MAWFLLAVAVLCLAGCFVFLKKRQDALEQSFQERFGGKPVRMLDRHALYVARQADGHSHFRGDGYLVLTDTELYFERKLNRVVVSVPVGSILKAERAQRLAGQSPGVPLLKVTFRTAGGQEDAIAWKVRELDRWVAEIGRLADTQPPPSG